MSPRQNLTKNFPATVLTSMSGVRSMRMSSGLATRCSLALRLTVPFRSAVASSRSSISMPCPCSRSCRNSRKRGRSRNVPNASSAAQTMPTQTPM